MLQVGTIANGPIVDKGYTLHFGDRSIYLIHPNVLTKKTPKNLELKGAEVSDSWVLEIDRMQDYRIELVIAISHSY